MNKIHNYEDKHQPQKPLGSTCDKLAWPNRKAAKRHAKKTVLIKGRDRHSAYKCPDCGLFHTTSVNARIKADARADKCTLQDSTNKV